MKFFLVFLLLTTISLGCLGQEKLNDTKDTLLRVISCSADGAKTEYPRIITANKFGFKYIVVDSLCFPNWKDSIYGASDFVEKYNDSIYKLIAVKYGTEWKFLFDKEFKRQIEIHNTVREFIVVNSPFQNLPKKFSENIEDRKFLLWVDETTNEYQFNVKVLSWVKNKRPHWNIAYRLMVDTAKKRIEIISRKKESLK